MNPRQRKPRADASEGADRVHTLARADLKLLGSIATERIARKGEVIFLEGDAATCLYVIVTGRIKVFSRVGKGREVIFDVLGPGQIFGEIALIDGGPRSAAAAATQRSRVYVLSLKAYLESLERSPRFADYLVRMMAERLRATNRRLANMATLDVRDRVLESLLHLAGRRRGVVVNISQSDLAALAGASREMVNRALKELAQSGEIETGRQKITLRPQAVR